MKRYFNVRGSCALPGQPKQEDYLSALERNGFIQKMMLPEVFEARFGCPRIFYHYRGRKRRYTADLLVLFVDAVRRPLVVEFKPKQKFESDFELREKLNHLKGEFDRLGQDFVVETEDDVYTAELAEKRFVFRYHNESPSAFDDEITALVRRFGALPIEKIIGHFYTSRSDQLVLLPSVWRLVAHKELFVDFRRKLDSSTVILAQPFILSR
ncbi:MAG: hypothetical protein WC378_00820 [Opitutaceae bacterium]|jgi:hypothetical protein